MGLGAVTFSDLTALAGGEMTLSRGVRPSTCLLRSIPSEENLDRKIGTLTFHWDEPLTEISFPDSAVAEVIQRNLIGREGWMFDIKVVDRRWKWRYHRIDGTYNMRAPDGTVHDTYKKNSAQLAGLLLDAMGETGYSVGLMPTTVFPPVMWNRARAALELEWLCDLLGFVVVLQLDNTVAIKRLNDDAGANLPDGAIVTPAHFPWKPAAMPATLRVQADPTVIQDEMTLEPVGLDSDGSIQPIDDLSYKPAGGWGDQWPGAFPSVAIEDRHLAFQTVWRWWRPVTTSFPDGDTETITSLEQVELLDHLVEVGADPDGVLKPLPPVVRGTFWPLQDLEDDTGTDVVYSGNFRILADKQVVEFEYPVYSVSSGQISEPTLKLITAYRVRKSDGSGYGVFTSDQNLSATGGSGIRVLQHPELTKKIVTTPVYGSVSSNAFSIGAEATTYLLNVNRTYNFAQAQDVTYNGIVKQDLDGAIAQISWRVGKGVPAFTRIGRYTEPSIYTLHQSQRKALTKLARLVEMFNG